MKLTQTKIHEFGKLIEAIGENLAEAGRLLVEMLEIDPGAKKEIVKAYPGLTISFLNQLEAVGRQQLHPRVALAANAGVQALRALPYSEQERYLTQPIDLVVEKDGEFDILLVCVADLTNHQIKQVFADNHIRSQGAQRAYLEDQKSQALLAKRTEELAEPYKIHKGGIVEFRAGVRMNQSQLLEIARNLAPKTLNV